MARSLIPFGGGLFDLAGPNLFREFQREMNRAFDAAFRGFGGAETPPIEVSETDREMKICAELPGVSADDVELELADDILTIRGEKKHEAEQKEATYHLVERSFGSFVRSLRLPFSVKPDQVQATFKDGILTITVPKAAVEQKAQRIEIRGETGPAKAGKIAADRAAAGDKPGGSAESAGDIADQSPAVS